ncbi:MAG: nucleotidyltransferase domain-containing protein [Chloroflexota bacterium]
MPVRSLNSSVLKWPDANTVLTAVRAWAEALASRYPSILKIGCFGSYARGDWGVGSDVDLLVVVAQTDMPFEQRALLFDATGLPVPADVMVYTVDEWKNLQKNAASVRKIASEVYWIFERSEETTE